MLVPRTTVHWTDTSPATATTALSAVALPGVDLCKADYIVVTAVVRGSAAGTTELVIQYQVATDVWVDWVHTQAAALGTKAINQFEFDFASIWSGMSVDGGTDASPIITSVGGASGTMTNVIPTANFRVLMKTGVGTTAGAVQHIYLTPYSKETALRDYAKL